MVTVAVLVAAVAGVVVTVLSFQWYLRWRGIRVVLCPRCGRCAAVEFDAGAAVRSSLRGALELRVRRCSVWPLPGCRQECVTQVEEAPDALRPVQLARGWYTGKVCRYCGKPIRVVEGLAHDSALSGADGRLLLWRDVPPADLPNVLAGAQPVCWSCYTTETFRARYPELVVEAFGSGPDESRPRA